MSAEAQDRRRDLYRAMRRGRGSRRPLTTKAIWWDVRPLYSAFAYGGKDRLHDDLVKLAKEGLLIRHSCRPAMWEVL